MIHTQPVGKNSRLFTLIFPVSIFLIMLSACSSSNDEPFRRGSVYASKNKKHYVFIDADSTYILTRKKGDVAFKDLGVVKVKGTQLVFLDGRDIESSTTISFHEGNSNKLSVKFTTEFLRDYPEAVLAVADTLIYAIRDTVVVIDKKFVFDKFQKVTDSLPEFYHYWEVYDRLFVSDLKIKSRAGYLSMFYDGRVDEIYVGKKDLAPLPAKIDTAYFKMKLGNKYITCSDCPKKFKFDTLFLE